MIRIIRIISFLVLLLPLIGFSEEKGKKQKRKVIKVEEIIIRNRVIKPQAMIILTKSSEAEIRADISAAQEFSEKLKDIVNEEALRK